MGKRSKFDRIEKDFYRTIDKRAGLALSSHIPKGVAFAEPCYGEGDLAFQLTDLGAVCVWSSDISEPEPVDALSLTKEDLHRAEMIISNPPWSRPILHPMIEHFSSLRPTWLLFDADWAHTKQSAPYMKWCRKIVSVGRLIWIPGTTMSGKDNCAWYLFDQNDEPYSGVTEFYGR